uniref:Uncharacterized protein n=1 Tax=Arundo donax TaxID=35708 RepID=A0A0A9BJX0_ARUDO
MYFSVCFNYLLALILCCCCCIKSI